MKPIFLPDLRTATVSQLNTYCKYISSFVISPTSQDIEVFSNHVTILRNLFSYAQDYSSTVFSGTLSTRNELAIFLSPLQIYRSPHYELVSHYSKLAKLQGLHPVIYLSLTPSLGHETHRYNYLKLGVDKFLKQLKELFSNSLQDFHLPDLRLLNSNLSQDLLLVDVVNNCLKSVYHDNSKPLYSLCLSGGGRNFFGSFGCEWLDSISTNIDNRYLAMMGNHDQPLNDSFYTQFVTHPGHPLASNNLSKSLYISLSLPDHNSTTLSSLSTSESQLLDQINDLDKSIPILLYTSNMLCKRHTTNDILYIHVLKFLFPNLKIVIAGHESDKYISLILDSRLLAIRDLHGVTFFLRDKPSSSVRLSATGSTTTPPISSPFYSSPLHINISDQNLCFSSTQYLNTIQLTLDDFLFTGWLDNIESFYSSLSSFNLSRPGCMLYTFCNNSGNGQTNSIAAYSNLPVILRSPNDSRRSLPAPFFIDQFFSYLQVSVNLLGSRSFNDVVRSDQQAYIRAFNLEHSDFNESTKFFHSL